MLALTATIFAITGCGSDSEPSSSDKTTKPSTEIAGSVDSTKSESENTSEQESESESVTEEPTTEETTEEPALDTSIQALQQIGLLTATCETDINACYVDVTSENPYDIVWDYGEEYEKYIAACDWSLVWDYDFYVKAFPALAKLYNYDEALLLRHFQTVGIHEGRQGCENFYIDSFINIEYGENDYKASTFTFCYLDYMLNHDKYAKKANNGDYRGFIEGIDDPYNPSEKCLQHINVMTALEKQKFEHIYALREDFNEVLWADPNLSHEEKSDLAVSRIILFDEATCFANLRAYLGAHDDYTGNDWGAANYMDYATKSYPFEILENTVLATYLDYDGKLTSDMIMQNINESSDEYKNYICNSWLDDIGISNIYYNPDTNRSSHVDVYSYYMGDARIYQHRGLPGYMDYRFKY